MSFVIYLDHNATTPILPEVLQAMMPYLTTDWGNPSSAYKFGARLKSVIETAREQLAELIGAHPMDVVFTSCATESNNAAIAAALKANPAKRHIVTSQVEHSSVLNYCMALEREGYNETGVLFPVERIAEACRSRGVLYHCDAVQAAGKVKIDVRKMQADYLSLTGHKFHAPKGIGTLYIRRKAPFKPYVYGGHQERNRRGGTESVPLIVAMGKAAELARKRLPDYERKVRPLRDELEEGMLNSVPETELNGHKAQRLANTTNITFHGIESESLLILLDKEGICASSGSACLADSDEPSHVIKAMKPESAASRQMIRFSLDIATTGTEARAVLIAVEHATDALRA